MNNIIMAQSCKLLNEAHSVAELTEKLRQSKKNSGTCTINWLLRRLVIVAHISPTSLPKYQVSLEDNLSLLHHRYLLIYYFKFINFLNPPKKLCLL